MTSQFPISNQVEQSSLPGAEYPATEEHFDFLDETPDFDIGVVANLDFSMEADGSAPEWTNWELDASWMVGGAPAKDPSTPDSAISPRTQPLAGSRQHTADVTEVLEVGRPMSSAPAAEVSQSMPAISGQADKGKNSVPNNAEGEVIVQYSAFTEQQAMLSEDEISWLTEAIKEELHDDNTVDTVTPQQLTLEHAPEPITTTLTQAQQNLALTAPMARSETSFPLPPLDMGSNYASPPDQYGAHMGYTAPPFAGAPDSYANSYAGNGLDYYGQLYAGGYQYPNPMYNAPLQSYGGIAGSTLPSSTIAPVAFAEPYNGMPSEFQHQTVPVYTPAPFVPVPTHNVPMQPSTSTLAEQFGMKPRPTQIQQPPFQSPSTTKKRASRDKNAQPAEEIRKSSVFEEAEELVTETIREQRKLKGTPANEVYGHEKPRLDPNRPGHRINIVTKGKNTRSSKVNNYNALDHYHLLQHPHGDWSVNGFHFKYNMYNELTEPTFTAEQMKSFIYNHPNAPHCKLTLWIQRTPSDSAKRYGVENHSALCRFRECPARRSQKGTIAVGHFRVALDELWWYYGENANPYWCSGFVHLDCMEKFLDFADICKRFNVMVDSRHLVSEPKQRWAGSLGNSPEGQEAQRFIEMCRKRTVYEKWPYPKHDGTRKPYESTLNCHMWDKKIANEPKEKNAIPVEQLSDGNYRKHRGNLEIFLRRTQRGNLMHKSTPSSLGKRGRTDEGDEAEQPPRRRSRAISTARGSVSMASGRRASQALGFSQVRQPVPILPNRNPSMSGQVAYGSSAPMQRTPFSPAQSTVAIQDYRKPSLQSANFVTVSTTPSSTPSFTPRQSLTCRRSSREPSTSHPRVNSSVEVAEMGEAEMEAYLVEDDDYDSLFEE